MAERISDSELLDLNDSVTGDSMENQSMPDLESTEWKDTQPNSHAEEGTQTTKHLQESQEEKK